MAASVSRLDMYLKVLGQGLHYTDMNGSRVDIEKNNFAQSLGNCEMRRNQKIVTSNGWIQTSQTAVDL